MDIYGCIISVFQYCEILSGGVIYNIIECDGDCGYWDSINVYMLKFGYYFMLGDNWDNFMDFCDEVSVGQVFVENILGYVVLIFWFKDKR